MAAEDTLAERRQRPGLWPRAILAVGFGTLGFVAMVLGMVWLFDHLLTDGRHDFQPPEAYAPPRLQSDPAGELRDFRVAQQAQLQRSDAPPPARIPIEQAMAMIVARGAEAYAPLGPAELRR